MISPTRSMRNSTRAWLTIGKIIWQSNTFRLKVNLNSAHFCSSQSARHSICSRTKNKRTRSSCTCDVSSSWITVMSSSQSFWTLSRVWSTPRTCPWTFLVKLFSNPKSWRLSERIWLRSASNSLKSSPKIRRTTKPSTSRYGIVRYWLFAKVTREKVKSNNLNLLPILYFSVWPKRQVGNPRGFDQPPQNR